MEQCSNCNTHNGVHMFWNEPMLQSQCCKMGQVHYIFYVHNKYKNHQLSHQERLTVAHMKLEQTANLPNKINLAIGMKTMVLQNIVTHANLANSLHRIITDIILHPEENIIPDANNKVYLQHPPVAILFSLFEGGNIQIPGLPKGVIPILPSCDTFSLGGSHRIMVHRLQLAITVAYAFTDYKALGQTMECIIVDLAKPPLGALTRFNVYVALSQVVVELRSDCYENLMKNCSLNIQAKTSTKKT